MALFDEVRDIVVNQLHVTPEKVTEEAHFVDDLGADSLDIVELVMAFEEKFGLEIPDEEAQKLDTVGKAVSYLEVKLSEKK
jgi:acyl carrier protein